MKCAVSLMDLKRAACAATVPVAGIWGRPDLSKLMLEAHDGMLELSCTDSAVMVRTRLGAVRSVEDGRAVLDSHSFNHALIDIENAYRRAFWHAGRCVDGRIDGLVEIDTSRESRGCALAAEFAQASVACSDPDEFLRIPDLEDDPAFRLPTVNFLDMIRRTQFSSLYPSPSNRDHPWTGVLVEAREGRVLFMATDGARLALCERPLSGLASPVSALVPVKVMQYAALVFADDDGYVDVTVGPERVQFRTTSATITAPRLIGNFEPREELTAPARDKILTLPCDSFVRAVHEAANLGDFFEDSPLYMLLRFSSGEVRLTIWDLDRDELCVNFPLDYSYEEMPMEFECMHFCGGLDVLSAPEFRLCLSGPRDPAVIEEDLPDGGRYMYVLMPFRVG